MRIQLPPITIKTTTTKPKTKLSVRIAQISKSNPHAGASFDQIPAADLRLDQSARSIVISSQSRYSRRRRNAIVVAADMVPDRREGDWIQRNGNHNLRHHNRQQQDRLSACHHQSGKLLTLPTILTLGRVAAVPLLVCTFYIDNWPGTTSTSFIFIIAAITDWLDGYLARKMKLGSEFGAFLDPVADKLMVAATLVLLCTRPLDLGTFGKVPWLLPVPAIAIIGREITMSAVREWAASQNSRFSEAVAVNSLGKWKTATQMTALTILVIARDSSLAGPGMFVASGVFLLYISAWLAIWSLYVYMGKIWTVLLN